MATKPAQTQVYPEAETLRGLYARAMYGAEYSIEAYPWENVPREEQELYLQMADAVLALPLLPTQKRLRDLHEALGPFAVIGGLLSMAGIDAIPNGASARYLKLDGLEARHFRDAYVALRNSKGNDAHHLSLNREERG